MIWTRFTGPPVTLMIVPRLRTLTLVTRCAMLTVLVGTAVS